MPQEEKVVEKILDEYPYVSLVYGTHNFYKLPEYIYRLSEGEKRVIELIVRRFNHWKLTKNANKLTKRGSYHAGCDEFCTYCIPYTRGKERSRLKDDIIAEVKHLVERGYKEVTLLGQNVNAYGKDLEGDYTFSDLLLDLDKTGIERIRFTTSHPRDFDDKTIEVFRTSKHVMPYVHLPLQSGSNKVLKKMNRGYTKERYLEVIRKLKDARSDISITTDIIVAFPTETEEDFLETLEIVNEVGFEGAYTFIFSPREGTPAFSYENNITEKRAKQIKEIERFSYKDIWGSKSFRPKR